MNTITLELHVPDFEKVKEYYLKLGFKVVKDERMPDGDGYLVLAMNDHMLCFWSGSDLVYEQSYFKNFPKDTKRGYGVEIIIPIDNIEEYYEKVKEFAHVVGELKPRHWGVKDFRVEDPYGYYLRFTEKYDHYT